MELEKTLAKDPEVESRSSTARTSPVDVIKCLDPIFEVSRRARTIYRARRDRMGGQHAPHHTEGTIRMTIPTGRGDPELVAVNLSPDQLF